MVSFCLILGAYEVSFNFGRAEVAPERESEPESSATGSTTEVDPFGFGISDSYENAYLPEGRGNK